MLEDAYPRSSILSVCLAGIALFMGPVTAAQEQKSEQKLEEHKEVTANPNRVLDEIEQERTTGQTHGVDVDQDANAHPITQTPTAKPGTHEAAPGAEDVMDEPKGMGRPPTSSKQDIRKYQWGASYYGPKKAQEAYRFRKDGTVTKGGQQIGAWSQNGDRVVFYLNDIAKRVALQYNPLSGAKHQVVADRWTGIVGSQGEKIDWDDGGVWGIGSLSFKDNSLESTVRIESGKNR